MRNAGYSIANFTLWFFTNTVANKADSWTLHVLYCDQSVTKKYEVEAGPLTSDEAEWIDQLFTAYDVFRIEADATNPDDPSLLAPVLITDCTC